MASTLRRLITLWVFMEVGMAAVSAEEVLWIVRDVPAHGLVVAGVNLAPLVKPTEWVAVSAVTLPDGQPIPVQFVPDDGMGTGTLVAQLPGGGNWTVQLRLKQVGLTSKPATTVSSKYYEMLFTDNRQAGYPSAILFRQGNKRFDTFVWNDRVHHREWGSFHLRYDPEARAEVVSDSEICTVVRVKARYCQPGGKRPPSEPEAVYHWFLFKHLPLAYVTAQVRQKTPFAWDEFHFLELNFPDTSFTGWAGGEPMRQEPLVADGKSVRFGDWGALVDGQTAVGMWGQPLIIHDGRGAYGTYLHSTWQSWNSTSLQVSTWLWVGSAENPINAVRQAAQQYGRSIIPSVVTTPALHQKIAAFRQRALRLRGRERQNALWTLAVAEKLESQGRLSDAERMLSGTLPANWHRFTAGDMGILLEQVSGGLRLQSLYDLRRERELLDRDNPALFVLTLRDAETRESMALGADAGWRSVTVDKSRSGFRLKWSNPTDSRLDGVDVIIHGQPDPRQHAIRWSLQVENRSPRWSLWRVVFPQVAVADLGEGATVLFPRGPGEIQRGVWHRDFRYNSTYPNGWCSMQFMAAYTETPSPTGLYFALHDPMGSTKDLGLRSQPAQRSVRLFFDIPVPNMGKARNSFTLSGQAVWQLLRGDWYDAARIYRQWVIREARWYPRGENASSRLHNVGAWAAPRPLKTFREWMRDLPAWSLASGGAQEVVPPVEEFAKYCGVPVGFHWYCWHQIPFDNDYPHYFPVKPGFAEGVQRLRRAGVFVMPYINGRLWDTRDKGMEDFEFSMVAKPAATKDEQGNPYTEVYGSKEADGSSVRLAVMCPTTALWQNKVREIVLRLFNEYGVNAVYIDQVAAAPPVLCFDPSHGHPLGGGHWWNEGYWQMLGRIRQEMPSDRAITTECNAEPFIAWFDGYLTWHWQHEGQVPAFPAIYSQAVQMFGRAYRGGATKDLALRMKAAQQLVFGEQIGWIDPSIVREEQNARFLRQMILLRWRYRHFFTHGEMARPPELQGDIPTVRADWQWGGEWWVSAPAVYTGAWQLPEQKRLVLFFVNVADEPVTATMRFNPSAYAIGTKQVQIKEIQGADGDAGRGQTVSSRFERRLSLPAHQAVVWEISW